MPHCWDKMASSRLMNTDTHSDEAHALSDETFDFLCSVCKRKGRNREAERYCVDCNDYYCLSCVKVHEDVPSMTRHQFLIKSQFQQGNITAPPMVPTERCEKHVHKLVDMYCCNHDDVCCAICLAAEHRLCQGIYYIPEFIQNNANASVLIDDQNKIESAILTMTAHQKTYQYDIQQLLERKTNLSEKIEQFRGEINERLDELKNNSVSEIDNKIKALTDKLEEMVSQLESDRARLKSVQDNIATAGNNIPQVFVSSKIGSNIAKQSEHIGNENKITAQTDVPDFKGDGRITSLLEEMNDLGIVRQMCTQEGKDMTNSNIPSDVTSKLIVSSNLAVERTTASNATTEQTPAGNATNAQTTTGNATTEQTPAGNATNAQTTTGKATTEQTTTGKATTEQTTAGNATTEQTTASKVTTEQTPGPAGNATPEQKSAGNATTKQTTAGIATTEQKSAGIATHEQTTAGNATTEQKSAGDATTEQTTAGNATTEQKTAGKATNEQTTAGNATSEQKPASENKPKKTRLLQIKHKMTVSTKHSSDRQDTKVQDCCITSDGIIILCDYYNKKLKCVPSWSERVINQCDLPGPPWQICLINDRNVAVSFGQNKEVCFFTVEVYGEMEKNKTIKTDHYCYGLAYSSGNLYISDSDTSIYMYNESGRKLKQFGNNLLMSSSLFGKWLRVSLRSLAVSDDGSKIYVTHQSNGLLMLDNNGQLIKRYNGKDLKNAFGCHCLIGNQGLLVCGMDSNNVLQFTPNCELVGEVLKSDGSRKNKRVFCDEEMSTMVVCWSNTDVIDIYILQ